MSKSRAKPRSLNRTSVRQTRVARALIIGSLLFFVGMIGLIRYLKHNQEIAAQQPALPKMTSYVMDEAYLIAPDERARLNERLRALYSANGPQVVVATIARVTKGSIAEDALERARAWRIGHAGRNDGVLLLIAESERKARIEVGYGLEGVLTDALTRLIIANRMERHLQAGEWTQAARGGVEGILDAVGQTVVAPNAGRPTTHEEDSLVWSIAVGAGKAIVIVFFLAVMALFFVVLAIVALSILQTILLAIPGVAPRLKASKRWGWIAKPLPVRAGGGSSSSDSSSDSGWSSSSSSSSDSSSDSGGGGDFGGGGSND